MHIYTLIRLLKAVKDLTVNCVNDMFDKGGIRYKKTYEPIGLGLNSSSYVSESSGNSTYAVTTSVTYHIVNAINPKSIIKNAIYVKILENSV